MKFLSIALALLILLCGCSKEIPEEPQEQSEILQSSEVEIIPSDTAEENIPVEEPENQNEEIPEELPAENPEEIPISENETENNGYDELILVNPTHFIPEDYEAELETVQGKYQLDKKAASSAKELLEGAKAAGFDIQLCSAYRTVSKSAELYERKVNQYIAAGYAEETAKTEAAKWVAPPGTSEHHTGLAMDLVSSDYWGYYSDLEHDYDKFDSFKWMYEHCAEYGFILRYPKDKQDITGITYEPWHYRYVGKEAAAYIMENGLCLEEYLEEIG